MEWIVIAYLVVGVILAVIWWNDEYKPEAEVEAEEDGESDEIEIPMVCMFLMLLTLLWPLKLIKNWFEGLIS